MRKLSILIPDGDDDRTLIVVRSLAYSEQIDVHVLTPKNRNVFRSRYCKAHELLPDGETNSDRLARVIKISESFNIDVLLPVGEIGIRFIQQNKDFLNNVFNVSPIPDIDLLNIVNDKWLLNEFLRKESFPLLKSILVEPGTKNEILDIPFPGLLKPRIGAGGIGIEYIETQSDYLNVINDPDRIAIENGYILQEFKRGLSIDLSVLCLRGEILAHINYIYDEIQNEYYMIDFNPRYWGTLTGSLIADVNFPFLTSQMALGIPFPVPEFSSSIYAIIKQRDIFHWIMGIKGFKGIPFGSTNLNFVLKDPLPALNI